MQLLMILVAPCLSWQGSRKNQGKLFANQASYGFIAVQTPWNMFSSGHIDVTEHLCTVVKLGILIYISKEPGMDQSGTYKSGTDHRHVVHTAWKTQYFAPP